MPDSEMVAVHLQYALGSDGMPTAQDWERAKPISFDRDWEGNNADPRRQTEVRVLWSADALYLRFRCNFRSLHVFDDAAPDGRRDQLWERDVAEVFLQPDRLGTRYYKEFEVSPNGLWIDLQITPDGGQPLNSGLRRAVTLSDSRKEWVAELAIPMKALITRFAPDAGWKVNFYRCEGVDSERVYLAWRPTNSPKPNFHVPASFGTLRFEH